jgi:colicin import membrane protein
MDVAAVTQVWLAGCPRCHLGHAPATDSRADASPHANTHNTTQEAGDAPCAIMHAAFASAAAPAHASAEEPSAVHAAVVDAATARALRAAARTEAAAERAAAAEEAVAQKAAAAARAAAKEEDSASVAPGAPRGNAPLRAASVSPAGPSPTERQARAALR